jgi:hypothetical protein
MGGEGALDQQRSITAAVRYGDIPQPVVFRGCTNLISILEAISRGIDLSRVAGVAQVPQISLDYEDYFYVRKSAWLDAAVKLKDPVDAVCDLTVDLNHGLVAALPGVLCLHTAAVELADGLYLLPATYRGGKSLLSAYLCHLGARLYTDDALLIMPETNYGMATGILPRLRLPLPGDVDNSFREFVRSRSTIRNDRYCYLNPKDSEMVPYGRSKAITGVILLDRRESGPPGLEPAGVKDSVKEIIRRNFARQEPASEIVDRITGIVAAAKNYHLVYSDVESAAKLLVKRVGIPDPGDKNS